MLHSRCTRVVRVRVCSIGALIEKHSTRDTRHTRFHLHVFLLYLPRLPLCPKYIAHHGSRVTGVLTAHGPQASVILCLGCALLRDYCALHVFVFGVVFGLWLLLRTPPGAFHSKRLNLQFGNERGGRSVLLDSRTCVSRESWPT